MTRSDSVGLTDGAGTSPLNERAASKHGTRRKARRAALELRYEAHVRGVSATELVTARQTEAEAAHARKESEPPKMIRPYTVEIIQGVSNHQERIDELLTTYSTNWPLDRMPIIDRELLRIGVWELLANPEVPASVVIDEAVSLAAELSTDDSPSFINALLDRIAKLKPMLAD